MISKLRYYYERSDMLYYQLNYFQRMLRSGMLLYGEKDLTIYDVINFGIHLKDIVCVDFMNVVNLIKLKCGMVIVL